MQALGQGVHALQDALAHQGTDMDNHDIVRDMLPGAKLYKELRNVTEGALVVSEVMSGNGKHLKSGMSLNIGGMSSKQLASFTSKLLEEIKKKDVNKINLIQ